MPTTDHEALREQAELYVLGALAPPEREAFKAHLASCADCTEHVRGLLPVSQALAYAMAQHQPPPGLRGRVLGSIVGLRDTAERAAVRPPRATLPWLAAAASLILAAALGMYAASLRSRIGVLELRLQQANERASAGDRQLAELRHAATEVQSRLAILAAPDVRRIDLVGQPPAPRSSARAFWSRSRGLVFTASNLPTTPTGKTYQLWVLTKETSPISAGLFKPDQQGRVDAVFGTPVDLPPPIGMAVTIEPEGGVPAPTGDKYLAGS
jgi:anti-sigma-K factor RskA